MPGDTCLLQTLLEDTDDNKFDENAIAFYAACLHTAVPDT